MKWPNEIFHRKQEGITFLTPRPKWLRTHHVYCLYPAYRIDAFLTFIASPLILFNMQRAVLNTCSCKHTAVKLLFDTMHACSPKYHSGTSPASLQHLLSASVSIFYIFRTYTIQYCLFVMAMIVQRQRFEMNVPLLVLARNYMELYYSHRRLLHHPSQKNSH